MEVMEHMREKTEGMFGREGTATKQIEKATSALPSTVWLIAAGASILGSMALKVAGRDGSANFVGQWAPTFLLLGLYNKLVKVAGHDQRSGAV